MSPPRWLSYTISVTVAAGAIVAGGNAVLDIYGLFRNSHDRKLQPWGDGRIAKYLLSTRYVPENFNGIFMGTSVSANWDVSTLGPYRVYNESLNGGNAGEERAIVERAIGPDGIRVAFLLVQPYLTHSHEFETTRLQPSLFYSAFGSLSLLDAYKDWLRNTVHGSGGTNWAGTESFPFLLVLNPTLREMIQPGKEFAIDPAALAAYRDLVATLRARQVQTVFVVPPIYEELRLAQEAAFANYHRRIREIAADDPWIDFDAEPYAAWRRNRANFGDGVHMYPQFTRIVVDELGARVSELVRQGRLHLP